MQAEGHKHTNTHTDIFATQTEKVDALGGRWARIMTLSHCSSVPRGCGFMAVVSICSAEWITQRFISQLNQCERIGAAGWIQEPSAAQIVGVIAQTHNIFLDTFVFVAISCLNLDRCMK